MTSTASAVDALMAHYNRGLAAWIDAGAELADCTAPATAELGDYAHRLAIPGASHPTDGERRVTPGHGWQWDAERHGWRCIAVDRERRTRDDHEEASP